MADEEKKDRDVTELIRLASWDGLNNNEVHTLVAFYSSKSHDEGYIERMKEENDQAERDRLEMLRNVILTLQNNISDYQDTEEPANEQE